MDVSLTRIVDSKREWNRALVEGTTNAASPVVIFPAEPATYGLNPSPPSFLLCELLSTRLSLWAPSHSLWISHQEEIHSWPPARN